MRNVPFGVFPVQRETVIPVKSAGTFKLGHFYHVVAHLRIIVRVYAAEDVALLQKVLISLAVVDPEDDTGTVLADGVIVAVIFDFGIHPAQLPAVIAAALTSRSCAYVCGR